jgi:pimeloyl-ACP methyl ester carboxylesterase
MALIAGGVLAAAIGIWLITRQGRIVFKPVRELLLDPSDLGLAFEDAFLPIGKKGVPIHGWWLPREDSRKLFLLLPGSIGNISHELKTLAFLHSLGAKVFVVDYPGFGKSEGRPTEGGCYLSAEAAWDFATRERGVRPEDVIIFGRSLGATVAARLASSHPDCGRLVLHSGFTSVPDVAARAYPFFPVRYFCYIRFNTLKQLRGCRCPIVVMHPTGDTVIPLKHSQRIFDAAPEPKSFVHLRGNHYDSGWQNTPGIRPALEELLS